MENEKKYDLVARLGNTELQEMILPTINDMEFTPVADEDLEELFNDSTLALAEAKAQLGADKAEGDGMEQHLPNDVAEYKAINDAVKLKLDSYYKTMGEY